MTGARRTVSQPGIRDVAAHAGVSLSSVSRVLSDAPFVSADLRARVLAAVEALGYRPNQLARSLRSQVSKTVGFIVGDISNPLFSRIVSGAEHTLRAHGYSVLLADSEGKPDLDRANVELLAQRRVDGLLVSLCSEDHEATYAALRNSGVPSVFIDRDARKGASQGAVLGDHAGGMTAAVEHLLDLGHRRIGFVGGSKVRPTLERMRALERCYERRGLAPDYRTATATFSEDFGIRGTHALLAAPAPCTALIFGGAHLLVGGLREIERRGLCVPQELSVVACDESDVTKVFRPHLSCIKRDLALLGREAATMLMHIVGGKRTRREVLVPARFDPGESCMALR